MANKKILIASGIGAVALGGALWWFWLRKMCPEGHQWSEILQECVPVTGECVENERRCSPTNPNIVQRCINGKWTDFLVCVHGCDPVKKQCMGPGQADCEKCGADLWRSLCEGFKPSGYIIRADPDKMIQFFVFDGTNCTGNVIEEGWIEQGSSYTLTKSGHLKTRTWLCRIC